MDYKEELLFSLFIEYRERFNWLNQTLGAGNFTQEYAQGGCTLHRGFYCPSPVLDIITGGNDRGHLVRGSRSSIPIDYLYLKADNKLRIVDKFEHHCDNTSHLYQREFIIDNGKETVAPIYRMVSNLHDLFFLSMCNYDSAGRIMQYLTFLPGYSSTGTNFDIDKKACLFYGEHYSYDDQTGLLESVASGQKMNGYSSVYSYRFYHDQTGQMVAYQSIGEMTGPIKTIPKKKRRVV